MMDVDVDVDVDVDEYEVLGRKHGQLAGMLFNACLIYMLLAIYC